MLFCSKNETVNQGEVKFPSSGSISSQYTEPERYSGAWIEGQATPTAERQDQRPSSSQFTAQDEIRFPLHNKLGGTACCLR